MPQNNYNKKNNNKRHPLTKIKRRARLIYLKIIRIDDPPGRIARGAAIGVLMGVLPTFGLGTLLSLGAAFVLKANKAAAVLGSFIVNPLTSPFFWTLSIFVGSFIMREDSRTILERLKTEGVLMGAERASLVYMVGNVLVSAVFTGAAYYLVKRAVIRHRKKKALKRLRRLETHGG
ncbi:MAG: DUF2062 domain-containing protein [Deltaproteobacteria bacterium]|nr:DUF2062 domain-containing protein [Deltaproteobacteria bacterium]